MTDERLRTTLQQIAAEATVVDLGPRVQARIRVVRLRRRLAAVAVPAVAALVIGALAVTQGRPDAAPPARGTVPTVDLSHAGSGGLADAQLSVMEPQTLGAWVVNLEGGAARLPAPVVASPAYAPLLAARGTRLAIGTPGRATVVDTVAGSVRRLAVPADRDYLPAVSPDGQTLAYALDNQVDAIELTLVPLDGAAATTLRVTTSAASGELVPVVWSDDGTAVLVLEGAGVTRVDVGQEPRARQGVHLPADTVLANGWAAAPDLSHVVMSSPIADGGRRTWLVFDSGDGSTSATFSRPADDRLIGWTPSDRLVWWHHTGHTFAVVSTDTAGKARRTQLRVRSLSSDLRASWTGDE